MASIAKLTERAGHTRTADSEEFAENSEEDRFGVWCSRCAAA